MQFISPPQGLFNSKSNSVATVDNDEQSIIRVTKEVFTDTPISKILCGNFIELGYGLQVEGMSAQMLFNRSFERFTPYNAGNKEWFGLFIDHKDLSAGYKTDWSKEDWYHSGYEHNPWYAVPGEAGDLAITDESAFLVNKSVLPQLTIALTDDAYHGKSALSITNGDQTLWGGVAQNGLRFEHGQTYRFRGWFKGSDPGHVAELRVFDESSPSNSLLAIPIDTITAEYSLFEATWIHSSLSAKLSLGIFTTAGSSLFADGLSLMPESNLLGWRQDVVDVVRQLSPSIIRFPGGCFASFYDWRQGVGPVDQRMPEPSYFWGGLNYNDIGTDEFAVLCKSIGSEMMLCVNLFHLKKDNYCPGLDTSSFVDEQQGIKIAADWVAYCNADTSHPMGTLRAQHGFHEPFGVKYWEMDNETVRWFTAEEYATSIVAYSKAMKAVDPTIKIGMMIYDAGYVKSLGRMLEIAGQYIDFVADRGGDEAALEKHLAPVRAYNKRNGTQIRYADTEWLADDFRPEIFQVDPAKPRTYWFNKWIYALNIPPCVMSWQRRGGDILFFNFNNLANTHGQSAIETPKDGVFLTGAGKLLRTFAKSEAAWPLRLQNYAVDEKSEIQAQAALNANQDHLILYALNRTAEETTIEFDLSEFSKQPTVLGSECLSAPHLFAYETADERDQVTLSRSVTRIYGAGLLSIVAPPYSFASVTISN